uniref:ASXL transcriptional regulator 1 n=1 Tax=Leptobrachium leishanense TaxID=445787 RepID=A0A8C5PUV0_9ANUR
MRDKQKRRRERTWAEAARMVLENYSDAPMTPKQILNVIEAEGLKETSGSSPLACLNTMLHSNSRTREALFYKLPGRISLFTMKKNATQWSRVVSVPEDGDTEDTADEEGSQWTESSSVTPAIEPSCHASCSGEFPGRETRSLVQINKQKRRSGVLLPRVVLTPLKVNGAHLPSTSGSSASRVEGKSTASRTIGPNLNLHRRAAMSRDNPHHLRGIRSTPPGQMKKNKAEEIDFETPKSILVNTNLRALINIRTFNALPHSLQQQLLLLLPDVDRQVTPEGPMRMSGSALNNEFFAHACQRWRERLAEGEFTPEAQLRMKQEMDKEKKVEDWKETFFEDFYGQKFGLSLDPLSDSDDKCVTPVSKSPLRGGQKKNADAAPKRSIPTARIRTRSVFRKEKEGHGDPPKLAEMKGNISPVPDSAEPEIPILEAHIPPKDEGNLPSTSDRVPELHPETSEHKRKNVESENASPSLEKKPRMEQRQSFRTTIQSVHPEKPQPTKEEPKVPPIRIQLSRIKPPWVDKSLPGYQICPRIISNPDPIGCWTNPCTPADCQTSGPQSSTSRGGGPGGGGSSRKRRTWSRNLKARTSSKRRQSRQYPNCCRTQLLSSSSLKRSRQKPPVPAVRIRWTLGVESTPFEAEGHGVTRDVSCKSIMEAAFNDAKDRCSAEEDVVSGTVCEGEQGYKAVDNVEPQSPKTVLEESMGLQPEARACCNKEKNAQLGVRYTDDMAPSESTDAEQVNQSSVESFVLGDVSNTFQNKYKPVVTKVHARSEPSECKGLMSAAEALQNGLPESKPFQSSANLQSSWTSTPGPLVELHKDTMELSVNRENEPFNCRSDSSMTPDLQKTRRNEAQLYVTTWPFSSLENSAHQKYGETPTSISNYVEAPTGEQTAKCETVQGGGSSFSTESFSAETLKKQPLCDHSDCPMGNLSGQDPVPRCDAGFSSDPIHDDMLFGSGDPLDRFQLKSGYVESRSPPADMFDVKQSLKDLAAPGSESEPTYEMFSSGKRHSKPYRKPKPLYNKASFARDSLGVPLIIALPYPSERGPDGQLQFERSPRSLHKNTKRSLWGKLFKGPQDFASYFLSTDVKPPKLANKYAVGGSAYLSMRVIVNHNGVEKISLRCSCSLKAMRTCKGCGAFCHNDCIGPAKLCVLCLVIR